MSETCALWFTEYRYFGKKGAQMVLNFPDEAAAMKHWEGVRSNIDPVSFASVTLCDDDENVIRQLFPEPKEQQP